MSSRLPVALLSAMAVWSAVADMRLGVCSHLTRTGFRDRESLCAKMASAGFSSVRTDFDWHRVEPRPGEWDFARFDAVVDSAEKHGLTVLPILTGVPAGVKPWEETARWSNFVARTVSRYRGRIPAYEVWNEQNTERFWHAPPNATNYLTVLRTAFAAAKAADPKCRVVIGGFSKVPLDFIEEIYRLGGRDAFDVMAVHPYDVFHAPEHSLEDNLRALRELMARHGDGDKPIWITELGWPTGVGKDAHPPFDRLKWTEAEQADFAARALEIARRCGIAAFYWYEFRAHDFDRGETSWGLVHSDLSEKPALAAFRTKLSVEIPADATDVERLAADELVKYVRTMTGRTLPVVTQAKGPAIRLARGAAELGDEGFRLKSEGDGLVVSGGRRGILYGVYELLERYGGVEWLAADFEVVPKRAEFRLPENVDQIEKPAIFFRASSWGDLRRDGTFQAKMRINGLSYATNALPGGPAAVFCRRLGPAHTFDTLVPPSLWFKSHPEYFSEIGGVRRDGRTQLCLTNPDVVDLVVSNVLSMIARDPSASDPSVRYIAGVSQNDWAYFCECPKCRAVDEEEGSHAGTLCRFVNQVAERVEAKRPGTFVETLIYQYTRKPPKKTRLRHNVIPCLCSIECSFSHPLAARTLPVNAKFMDDLEEWGRRSDNLYIWDYTTDYNHYLYPMPDVLALQPNIQTFVRNGAKYLYEEGHGRYGAYFAALKSWLIAKLMWNPDQPLEPLLRRFFAGYYGAAAPQARAYFDAMEALVRADPKTRLSIWEQDRPHLLTDRILLRERARLAEAAAAVKDDPARLGHVRDLQAGLACVWVDRRGSSARRFWATRHPERFDLEAGLREDVAFLRTHLAAAEQNGRPIEIANRPDKCERTFEIWRAVENFDRPALGGDRAFLGTDDIHFGGAKFGKIAKDPSAVGGRAIQAWNYAEGDAANVFFGSVAFDAEARYRVRVRIRCERAEDGRGEAFNCTLGGNGLRRRIEEVKDGWQWYEFPARKLNDGLVFTFRSGRFGEGGGAPAVKGVFLDAVEIVREPDAGDPSLADGFGNPPRGCRPEVWWWTEGLKSAPEAAIVRDLEAMRKAGLSAFHLYGGSATDANWRRNAVFALGEATRLGLDAYLMVGAAGCGHPDTPLGFAPKDLVFTTATCRTTNGVLSVRLPRKGKNDTPKDPEGRPQLYTDIVTLAVPARENAPLDSVRDVSAFLRADADTLTWTGAPEGTWTVVRVAWVPLRFGWTGCYIDHLSREAMDDHWARVVTPLIRDLPPAVRPTLKGVLCDSWEARTASWTPTLADEFRRRRGYDLRKWLAAKAGLKVGTPAARQSFLRDFNETVSELLAENHYAYKTRLAHREGLAHVAEACGPHQTMGDVRRMQGRCDVAMGEFWMPSAHRPTDPQRFMLRDAASAAHVYGLPEVLAEAFTTINTYWTEAPSDLKPCADRAFCDGLTRVCYHGMMLSPSLTDRPGKIRAAAQHYNPQNTWFYQSVALNDYLSRCSWMLSRGRFAADALVYAGDAINVFASLKTPEDALGEGYDYDFCPTEALVQARVEDGEVVLPSGMRYRAVVVSDKDPAAKRMGTGDLKSVVRKAKPYAPFVPREGERTLKRLEQAGVAVLRTRAARAEWTRSHLPDVFVEGGEKIDWIHRRLDDGDVYFISSQSAAPQSFAVLLRASGKSVELWNAVTGRRTVAAASATDDGRTRVRLDLAANGSAFVVLAAKPSPGVEMSGREGFRQDVGGPWTVAFDPRGGVAQTNVVMDPLTDWTTCPQEGVRHYSGTASYRKTLELDERTQRAARLVLDLGEVANVAEVSVNGVSCGIAWTAPFRVEIPPEVRAGSRALQLEVKVTNLWPNRLIGDATLPKERRLTRTNMNPYKGTEPLLKSGLLGPVRLIVWYN